MPPRRVIIHELAVLLLLLQTQASLLIYKNTVVGADVLSPALDGFIHGLEMPQAAPSPQTAQKTAVQELS